MEKNENVRGHIDQEVHDMNVFSDKETYLNKKDRLDSGVPPPPLEKPNAHDESYNSILLRTLKY